MRFSLNNKWQSRNNLAALAAIQGGNALFPLVVFPYLLLKIGVSQFSTVALSEAVAVIGLTIALYSFDVTGVRRIVHINQEETDTTQFDIWLDILAARFVVLGGQLIVASIILKFLDLSELLTLLVGVWVLYPLGVVLQSGYFFQARKDNVPLAIAVMLSRIIACACVFVFVRGEGDAVLAVALISGSYFLSGLISAFYVIRKFGTWPKSGIVARASILLKEDWDVFIAGLSVVLYRGANTLILGMISAPAAAISLYALAEKYIKMLQAIVYPLSQHEFPGAVSALINAERPPLMILWERTRRQVVIVATLSIAYFPAILFYQAALSSDVASELAPLILIMLPAATFGVANFMFGPVGMVATGKSREYLLIVFSVGCMALLLCIIFAAIFDGLGAAVAYTLAEVSLCLALVTSYRISGVKRGEAWMKS